MSGSERFKQCYHVLLFCFVSFLFPTPFVSLCVSLSLFPFQSTSIFWLLDSIMFVFQIRASKFWPLILLTKSCIKFPLAFRGLLSGALRHHYTSGDWAFVLTNLKSSAFQRWGIVSIRLKEVIFQLMIFFSVIINII